MYILVFLANKIDGHATHKVHPKIIGGESVDVVHRPFTVNMVFFQHLRIEVNV